MRNGGYDRWFLAQGRGSSVPGLSQVLPGLSSLVLFATRRMLSRGGHFPCTLVASWLSSALKGTPCRDRSFLAAQGVDVPPPADDISWTDQREHADLRPSHPLLWRWSNEMSTAGRPSSAHTGSDARHARRRFTCGGQTHRPAGRHPPKLDPPWQVALGFFSVLRQSSDEYDPMPDLVRTLARRRLPPSHPRCTCLREERLHYDSLVT